MLPAVGFRRPSMHSKVVVLPRAVRPHDAEDLAAPGGERHVVHRREVAVALRQVLHDDDIRRRGSGHRSGIGGRSGSLHGF